MILKVTFREVRDGEQHVMLFGDSYKKWQQQYLEYRRMFPTLEPVEAEKSGEKWIGWGGLKWCAETEMQTKLNREGCQAGEPDAIKPRLFSTFKFRPFAFSLLPRL